MTLVTRSGLRFLPPRFFFFFFFNDTAPTEIYPLSLHDALPILTCPSQFRITVMSTPAATSWTDRKSTRLNSSHPSISYAVFCLKKKQTHHRPTDAASADGAHQRDTAGAAPA